MRTNLKQQIEDAYKESFSGWDFSYITKSKRMVSYPLSWNYESIVRSHIKNCESLLDMGTGGGEFLSSLTPLPKLTYATESYVPNVDVAKKRLNPLGIEVMYVPENKQPPYSDKLPFSDNYFDLIINRHEAYYPNELKRILKKDGVFITQQVGFLTCANLEKDILGKEARYGNWNLQSAINELKSSGFKISYKNEELTKIRFSDIGAIVYYLKAIPWVIESFEPLKYIEQLSHIDDLIEENGYYEMLSHRFVIIAN